MADEAVSVVVDEVDLEVETVEEEEGLELGNPLSVLVNAHSEKAADVIEKEVEVVTRGESGVDSLAEATEKVEEVDMKGKRGVDSPVVDGVEVEEGAGSVGEVEVDLVVEDAEEDSVDVVGTAEIAEVVETDIKSSHSTEPIPIPIVKYENIITFASYQTFVVPGDQYSTYQNQSCLHRIVLVTLE